MVSSSKVLPHLLRMSASHLEYVVFVLVEKYREQNRNDSLPTWWPTSIEFSHPMIRDRRGISDWKNTLLDVIASYYRSTDNSEWLRDLIYKTFTNDDKKYIHLIHDGTQQSTLSILVENKTNHDIIHLNSKQNEQKEWTESKICIKENALIKLLPQPVVSLYDVIKYGFNPKKEKFLLELNLMKVNKLIDSMRCKFRYDSHVHSDEENIPPKFKEKDKNIPQNGFITKPKIPPGKNKTVISPCYVKLNTNETETQKIATETRKSSTSDENLDVSHFFTTDIKDFSLINLVKTAKKSSVSCLPNLKTDVKNNEPPFLILTPVTINKYIEQIKTNSKKKKSTDLNQISSKKHRANNTKDDSKKVVFKKSKIKKNIIKIKWLNPKLKMKHSI